MAYRWRRRNRFWARWSIVIPHFGNTLFPRSCSLKEENLLFNQNNISAEIKLTLNKCTWCITNTPVSQLVYHECKIDRQIRFVVKCPESRQPLAVGYFVMPPNTIKRKYEIRIVSKAIEYQYLYLCFLTFKVSLMNLKVEPLVINLFLLVDRLSWNFTCCNITFKLSLTFKFTYSRG